MIVGCTIAAPEQLNLICKGQTGSTVQAGLPLPSTKMYYQGLVNNFRFFS